MSLAVLEQSIAPRKGILKRSLPASSHLADREVFQFLFSLPKKPLLERDHDRGPLPERQRVATHGISHDSAIRRGELDHRVQMRPCRGSGVSVCFLPTAFWLLSGSGFGATPHNVAHHVFMTLQAYTSTSEDQERHLGSGFRPWRVGKCREAMLSTYSTIHSATFLTVSLPSKNSVKGEKP